MTEKPKLKLAEEYLDLPHAGSMTATPKHRYASKQAVERAIREAVEACIAVCMDRVASHYETICKSKLADPMACDNFHREAFKCGEAIRDLIRNRPAECSMGRSHPCEEPTSEKKDES